MSLPAIIAIDIASAAWWRSLGVAPAAVVGHSTGEIAAAHIAGALDLDDTMRVICAYGKVIGRTSGQGGMMLAALPWDEAEAVLEGYEGRVFRAIQDSARATVFAGEPAALAQLLQDLQARGEFARAVSMNVSPHCPRVDGLRDELFELMRGIRPRQGEVPLVSEVTGEEVDGRSLDAAHWVRNFGDPALFSRAVDTLLARGHRIFLDVGPHPLNKHSIETNLKRAGAEGVVLASLRREEDERSVLLDSLGALHALGAAVRWGELYAAASRDDAPAGAELEGRASAQGEPPPPAFLLPLSARSPEALVAAARAYGALLDGAAPGPRTSDIVYTASVRRDHHPHRLAIAARSRGELAGALSAFARGEAAPGVVQCRVPGAGAPEGGLRVSRPGLAVDRDGEEAPRGGARVPRGARAVRRGRAERGRVLAAGADRGGRRALPARRTSTWCSPCSSRSRWRSRRSGRPGGWCPTRWSATAWARSPRPTSPGSSTSATRRR